jgi:hypothetical protein
VGHRVRRPGVGHRSTGPVTRPPACSRVVSCSAIWALETPGGGVTTRDNLASSALAAVMDMFLTMRCRAECHHCAPRTNNIATGQHVEQHAPLWGFE